MLKNKWFLLVLAVFPALAMAADPASLISQANAAINNYAMGAAATVAIILEFVFRLLPTQKPLSWLWVADSTLKALSSLCSSAAGFLDKVLPQNIDQQSSPSNQSQPPKS